MSAYVQLEFVKQNSWINPGWFEVYHSEGSFLLPPYDDWISGREQLWAHEWEKAGFGYGRFGYGSFGWAQGGVVNGGFGYGRFGRGEFGYYNGVVQWTTPLKYEDGMHTFGISIFSKYGVECVQPTKVSVLIISAPDDPKQILFEQMNNGVLTIKVY